MSSPQQVIRDYKPDSYKPQSNVRRAPWFAAGLGIPLLAIALIAPRSETEADAVDPDAAESVQVASLATSNAKMPRPDAADVTEAPLVAEAAPVETIALPGEEIQMKVRSGDSLDRLFKRNKLNRADLAKLMQLDSARKHLRLVKLEMLRAKQMMQSLTFIEKAGARMQ